MEKNRAIDFWKTCFHFALIGEDNDCYITNPAIDFTEQAQSGKFDTISDEDYKKLLHEVEEVSIIFQDQPRAHPIELFNRALRLTPLSAEERAMIIRILVQASMKQDYSVYKTEKKHSKKQHVSKTSISENNEFLNTWNVQSSTPPELYSLISEDVYGQEEAKKAVSMLLFDFFHHRPSNLLLAGPTGAGKSTIINAIRKILPNNAVYVLDGSRLGADGYRAGVKLADAFENRSNNHFVLVIDEFDKACQPHFSHQGTNYSQLLQNQLLLLLDHTTMTFPVGKNEETKTVDTSEVSIILCGAWENLMQKKDADSVGIGFGAKTRTDHNYDNTELTPDDFISYGVRRELCGRIHDMVMLHPMTIEDFRKMLDAPSLSPIDRLAAQYGVSITATNELKDKLAETAYKSGLGCRAIYSEIRKRIHELMYEDCTRTEYHLDVSPPQDPSDARKSAPASIPNYDYAYAD